MTTSRTKVFRNILRDGKATLMPGAYDALSARLIERAGFSGVYIGSYATGASGFGVPDVGLLTMSELADYARKLGPAVLRKK